MVLKFSGFVICFPYPVTFFPKMPNFQKPQLFILPFAGGNVYSFHFLTTYLKSYDVITIELPGRGKRMEEKLLTDFDDAAVDVYSQIISRLASVPFLIYGHSLGSSLGLRVANMLEKENRIPEYLVFSGNPGPRLRRDRQWYLLEKVLFLEKIKNLGGIPDELMTNNEFVDFIEPVFRSDFELAERNMLIKEPPVTTPIYAIMGDLEKEMIHITNWKRFTKSNFSFKILSGDHFFIYRHPKKIASILQQCFEYKLCGKRERDKKGSFKPKIS